MCSIEKHTEVVLCDSRKVLPNLRASTAEIFFSARRSSAGFGQRWNVHSALARQVPAPPPRVFIVPTLSSWESLSTEQAWMEGAYYTAESGLNDFLGSKPIVGNTNYPLFVRANKFYLLAEVFGVISAQMVPPAYNSTLCFCRQSPRKHDSDQGSFDHERTKSGFRIRGFLKLATRYRARSLWINENIAAQSCP